MEWIFYSDVAALVLTGIFGGIMSRNFFPCCVGIFAFFSFIVGGTNLGLGCYFLGMFLKNHKMKKTICNDGVGAVASVHDYERITYDYYMMSEMYINLYMCS